MKNCFIEWPRMSECGFKNPHQFKSLQSVMGCAGSSDLNDFVEKNMVASFRLNNYTILI